MYFALLVASVAVLIVLLYIVPRRALTSFIGSDLLERRIREVVRDGQLVDRALAGMSDQPEKDARENLKSTNVDTTVGGGNVEELERVKVESQDINVDAVDDKKNDLRKVVKVKAEHDDASMKETKLQSGGKF